MEKEIDCIGTYEIVCPYCGEEQDDSFEYGMSSGNYNDWEGDIDCENCEETFFAQRRTEVTYGSYKS